MSNIFIDTKNNIYKLNNKPIERCKKIVIECDSDGFVTAEITTVEPIGRCKNENNRKY